MDNLFAKSYTSPEILKAMDFLRDHIDTQDTLNLEVKCVREGMEEVLKMLIELDFRRKHSDILEEADYAAVSEFEGRVVKSGQKYKHFKKGNVYTVVIAKVFDTDDLKEYVVYRGQDNKRRMWARPVEEFLSEVDHEKYPDVEQQYRFELVEDVDSEVE